MADLRNVNPLPFEARSAGSVPRPVADAEAFRWGSRFVEVPTAGGGTAFREVPLHWEDLFDPQEGDVMTHGTRHGILIREVAVMLQHWFESQGRSDVAVYDDVKMIWDDPAIAQVAPDVSVIPNVRDKERNRPSFRVAEEGTRPCLVLEFVSPDYAKFDLEGKPPIYRQAGVAEYLVFDLLRQRHRVRGWRLNPKTGRYRKMERDVGGRIYSETTKLWFSVTADTGYPIVEDAATGERLRNLTAESALRETAERRTAAEARRAADEAAAREAAERRAAEAEAKLARLEAELKQRDDSR